MDVEFILLLVSLIVVFGYIAEKIFEKIGLPDTLFLIGIGFIIGPSGLNYIKPQSLGILAPLLTTITLLFLMFDGALYIDLKSFAEGVGKSILIGLVNFALSTLCITLIFFFVFDNLLIALMLGFCLGGVSSAFVIPVLKQVEPKKKVYSILTLESAITDVLAIVFAIAIIELIISKTFQFKGIFSEIASLFSVAGTVGILAGFLWIFIEDKIIEKDRYYMVTVGYVVLIYIIAEYLGGNGAIAALFVGMVLANSKMLISFLKKIKRGKVKLPEGVEHNGEKIEDIVTRREKQFYEEISFFLKTFFFVYIGMLLNIKNLKAMAVGSGIAICLFILRNITSLMTKTYAKSDRLLFNSLFARGIAPAVIILIALERNIKIEQTIVDCVYFVITLTIVLSAIRIFIYRLKQKKSLSSTGKK